MRLMKTVCTAADISWNPGDTIVDFTSYMCDILVTFQNIYRIEPKTLNRHNITRKDFTFFGTEEEVKNHLDSYPICPQSRLSIDRVYREAYLFLKN